MRLIADTLLELPFKLDFCATKQDVDPLTCELHGFRATLYFPPTLSEGTDGQGVFGDWAWWTGRTLRLVLERDVPDVDDVDALRAESLATGNEILRRFLNACRWRLGRPDVHPVTIDPRTLTLEALHDDGTREALTEPFAAFFYKNMPQEPPLATSVNVKTLDTLQEDVRQGREPPMSEQLRLDADALERQGEHERANILRRIIQNG